MRYILDSVRYTYMDECEKEIEELQKDYYISDKIYGRGFILQNGTIIEIGYEDHRILSVKCWDEKRVVTYHIDNYGRESIWIRINGGYLTSSQRNVLDDFFYYLAAYPIDVLIEVYDGDLYKNKIEITLYSENDWEEIKWKL